MANIKKLTLLFGDILILYSSLALALMVRYRTLNVGEKFTAHIGPFTIIFAIWILIFYLTDSYKPKNLRNASAVISTVVSSVLISTFVSVVVFYFFGSKVLSLTPRITLFIFSFVFLALNSTLRVILTRFFVKSAQSVMILGKSKLIEEMVSYLKTNPHTGFVVTNWIKNIETETLKSIKGKILKDKINLIVTEPHFEASNLNLIYNLLPLEVSFKNFFEFYETIFEKVPLEELSEGWFIENIKTKRPFYDILKKLVDLTLASWGIIILSPLLLFIALFIKLTSKGPIIFSQERMGKNEELFTLYKFRTMQNNHSGPLWTENNDNRITKIGKILRFTHLDEAPQLFNILRGDISLIGPRPEAADLAKEFSRLPYYEARHIIKPGLTGWAQISYKPSASLLEAYEKLKYDIFYIKNRSFIFDILIVLKTIRYVFISHG